MNFPNADKLRRAKIILKEKGFKGEEYSHEYWLKIVDIYENILGGKVLGRAEKPKKEVKKKAKPKPKAKPKKRLRQKRKLKRKNEELSPKIIYKLFSRWII